MKGQYFSFDAIIATVIMVLAFSSLVAYWYGAQSVVESRTYSRLADAGRIAESLLSPGSPSDWADGQHDMADVRQIGIATGFNNELDLGKVGTLEYIASPERYYDGTGNLLRAGGNYFILIQRTATDANAGESPIIAQIGKSPINANATAVANRGATLNGRPVSIRVFLWK
ncbi:MAG: hypothetical protein WC263_01725 [Candidatus Micrarchaeia archaeon]